MISADSSSLLRHRSFLLFLLTRSFSRFSSQVAAVAIGWQIYDLTASAFGLGMVGLVQFLPTELMLFVARRSAQPLRRRRGCRTLPRPRGRAAASFSLWGRCGTRSS